MVQALALVFMAFTHQGIPSTENIADCINKMLAVLETHILRANPDCGLKTWKYPEVKRPSAKWLLLPSNSVQNLRGPRKFRRNGTMFP
uniref:Cobalamin-independent methionine synthase MetE C-terminal/archaeal domain-containing protein n=1 Tax=Rhizophora mucronata TaxID=61149 RepID=A0A2P2QIE8_RHIMU